MANPYGLTPDHMIHAANGIMIAADTDSAYRNSRSSPTTKSVKTAINVGPMPPPMTANTNRYKAVTWPRISLGVTLCSAAFCGTAPPIAIMNAIAAEATASQGFGISGPAMAKAGLNRVADGDDPEVGIVPRAGELFGQPGAEQQADRRSDEQCNTECQARLLRRPVVGALKEDGLPGPRAGRFDRRYGKAEELRCIDPPVF